MRKTRKYLRFEQIKIQISTEHPKEISRAMLCLRDQDNNLSKTQHYGQVTSTTIQWPKQNIQILYTNQQLFNFQTVCEHQYGYQKEQLKAIYNGQIYIKTQYFFRPLTVHVFNDEGSKCGIMRYMIKVIEKDVEKTANQDDGANRNQPEVQVQLIAKINFYEATMKILTPTFKKDKYINDLSLQVFICGKKIDATYKKQFQWNFPSLKIQYTDKSPTQVLFSLRHQEHQILKGNIDIELLAENKRFISHTIPLYDNSNQKIAILKVDLRYVSKQQLLDLLYSPTKLSNTKLTSSKPNFQKLDKHEKLISSKEKKSKSPSWKAAVKSNSVSMMQSKKQKKYKPMPDHDIPDSERTTDRYRKIYIMNSHKEMIIPKAKRFTQYNKSINPYVSYCDPDKQSDFSPKKHHFKYSVPHSKKMDITKPYKANPGPGSYKLPSIWEKY